MAANPTDINRVGKTPKPNFDGTIWSIYPNGNKPDSAPVGNIFSHGFEDASYDTSVTAEGAGWNRTQSTTTSIVRDDQRVVANDSSDTFDSPSAVIDGRQWENSEFSPGSHAVRFRYASGNQAQSELRFGLGTFQEPDIWLRWDLRVPINFTHEAVGGGSDNNKLLRLWHTNYNGPGAKIGLEFRADGSGTGSSNWQVGTNTDGGGTWSSYASAAFCTVPDDRGKWMRIALHAVCETSTGASDGIIEVWRKWEGEGAYTKVFDLNNLPMQRGDGTVAGFNVGYLMGYANSGYNADTEWLADNFNISTGSLL